MLPGRQGVIFLSLRQLPHCEQTAIYDSAPPLGTETLADRCSFDSIVSSVATKDTAENPID